MGFVHYRTLLCCLLLNGCTGPTAPAPSLHTTPPRVPAAEQPQGQDRPVAPARGDIELVESWPVGTSLDHSDIRDTHVVWGEMIDRAERSIDLAHFYASNHTGGRLERIIVALEGAQRRGVQVRFLADRSFADKYPDTLARLTASGIAVRHLDPPGGILHAKYMIVDRHDLYLGSANFDWRSLEHIQELGVRAVQAGEALVPLFDGDWLAAEQGGDLPALDEHAPYVLQGGTVTVLASPGPSGAWDLPRLVGGIAAAKDTLRVQLLNYRTSHYDGRPFTELHDALASAVERGVSVRLLLANWATKYLPSLRQLHAIGVELRIVTIPAHSGGFVPYARVAHSKYMVVDDGMAWIGTSNWGGDYFHASRNVGLWIDGDALPPRLVRLFDELYASGYSDPFDPARDYQPPKLQ